LRDRNKYSTLSKTLIQVANIYDVNVIKAQENITFIQYGIQVPVINAIMKISRHKYLATWVHLVFPARKSIDLRSLPNSNLILLHVIFMSHLFNAIEIQLLRFMKMTKQILFTIHDANTYLALPVPNVWWRSLRALS
jgi:hypothetical protein